MADSKQAPDRRLRERFREETRLALLAGAEAAFARDGAHGARMEDIASAAGVAVGTVYNYFSDREQLLTELLQVRRRELLARLDRALEGASGEPFRARLEIFLRTAFEHFDEHRALFRLLLEEELSVTRGAAGKRSMMRELVSRVERIVAAGLEARELRPDDAEIYPSLLLGSIRGLVAYSVFQSKVVPLKDQVERTMRFFLEGTAVPR